MDTPISILKRMDKDEREGYKGSNDSWINICREKALRHLAPSGHQARNIFWLGTDQMNNFTVSSGGLPDIDLDVAPIFCSVSGINDCVLKLNKLSLVG